MGLIVLSIHFILYLLKTKNMKQYLFLISFLISNATIAQNISDSSLVLFYPLNGNVNDTSLNQINGTLMNGVTFTNDRNGNANSALLFDGVDDFILVSGSPKLYNLAEPYSIALWMRIDGWFINDWAAILSKSSVSQLQLRVVIRQDHTLWLAPYPGCENLQLSSFPALGTWFHFALVEDTTNVKVYINCTLVDSFLCTDPLVPNTSALRIGRDIHGSSEYFMGAMDDVSIYNRALSAQEICQSATVSVNDNPATSVSIYPTLASNYINVRWDKIQNETYNIDIINPIGQVVSSSKHSSSNINLDVSGLVNGMYMIVLKNKHKVISQKFIKQ